MAVFLLDTWTVVKGKEMDNEEVVKQILQYSSKHPEAFKLVKSLHCFRQSIGGKPPGRFVLVTEFESLYAMEEFSKRLRETANGEKLSVNGKKLWI
jgi:hypothetical protein